MGKQVISYAGDKVKVTITSKFSTIPTGEQGDNLPMLVRVEAPPTTKKHVPVDLVALLDVSSTMNTVVAPGTTRLDLLKKAVKFVIQNLHGDDRLAIVPFNEKIRTYDTDLFVISSQRVSAQNKVNNLMAKGNTEFSPALEQAVKILDERSDKNRVGVIMLLTDGMDSTKTVLYPIRHDLLNKYPIHTFGICVHDPNLLLSIAQQSLGTYSFVDDGELGKIADPFAVLIGGLDSIVAVDVQIKFWGNSEWRSWVKLIECGFQSSEIIQPPGNWKAPWNFGEMRIGMLYAGEVKNYIVHVQIDPDTSGSRKWAQIEFWYNDAPGSSRVYGDAHNQYFDTGKQAGDPLQNSRMVRAQIVQFSALDLVSTLEKEFRDQKNTACAKGVSQASAAKIRAGSTLETRWKEFLDTMDDDLMDELDLEDLKEEVQEMVRRLKSGAGMAYLCSWLSSQHMQRATTPGSVDAVGAQFFTPAMDRMLSASKKYHVPLPQPQPQVADADADAVDVPSSKLDQRKADWEKLKSTAQQLLNQPTDLTLAQTWTNLKGAIDKAKDDDITAARKRGET